MPRVVHFEVYADDIDRASKFYGEVFGWSVNKIELEGDAVYWIIDTGEEPAQGINGGMMPRTNPGSRHHHGPGRADGGRVCGQDYRRRRYGC